MVKFLEYLIVFVVFVRAIVYATVAHEAVVVVVVFVELYYLFQ